jgi:hypothetical protein
MHLDFGAHVRKEPEARRYPRANDPHLAPHEMLDTVAAGRARWTVDHERLNPAAGPAADPDSMEIADVVGVQVRVAK